MTADASPSAAPAAPATPAAAPPAAPAATPPSAATPPAAASPPASPAAATPPAATPPEAKTPEQKAGEAKPWIIPEAYKDKPWAAKIKSEEDLYKQVDNLTSLVGKKTVVPDFKTAAPADIEAYLATTRPADKKAYVFGENSKDPTFDGAVADILYENGISEYQANKLIPAYQAMEQKRLEQVTSAEGFKEVMTKRFGEKYDANVVNVTKQIEKFATPEDKGILDLLPNEYLGTVYNTLDKMSAAHAAEIAALKKQYGVHENGDAHVGGGAPPPPADVGKERATLRAEMKALDSRPHTQAERQVIIDKLDATYRKAK